MKSKIFIILLVLTALLSGCSQEESFERFFKAKMKEQQVGEDGYSLIYKEMNVVHENDAIAIFVEHRETEESIFIAYFEKEKNKWNWIQTRGTDWNSPVKWTSTNREPYIYSGAISDNSISKVYVGDKECKIIDVSAEKRFWYVISNVNDGEVTIEKRDGTKELLKEL